MDPSYKSKLLTHKCLISTVTHHMCLCQSVPAFSFDFSFPHLTCKLFVLLHNCALKAPKSCPHTVTAIAGRAVEIFAGSGSLGSSFLFHKLHPVWGSGFLLLARSGKGTDKTHLLASATLQRKFGRSMCLDKHDLFLSLREGEASWHWLCFRYKAQRAWPGTFY